jgi:hypothetical protein
MSEAAAQEERKLESDGKSLSLNEAAEALTKSF